MQMQSNQGTTGTASRLLELPSSEQLLAALHDQARTEEPISRYLKAVEAGFFTHPDGRRDNFEGVFLLPEQAALLAHLCRECNQKLSVEVGFGMGTSASVILSTRRQAGKPFRHVIFDPWGLDDNRGDVVQSYLMDEFGSMFERIPELSAIGLGALLKQEGAGAAGLIFIDGGHHFETVMADFVLADLLCSEGGYIVFDDGRFPAIEAVISYISANRPNFRVAHIPDGHTSVLQKSGPDLRQWDSFHPFAVPDRHDWTPVD